MQTGKLVAAAMERGMPGTTVRAEQGLYFERMDCVSLLPGWKFVVDAVVHSPGAVGSRL